MHLYSHTCAHIYIRIAAPSLAMAPRNEVIFLPFWRGLSEPQMFTSKTGHGSKQVCRLKQTCTPTAAARKYLTTITDVFLLNYAVSLDEAHDGIQKNTQGVWPCKLPIDSLPLQQLASSPALMSCLSKQPRRWFPTAVGDTVQKKSYT